MEFQNLPEFDKDFKKLLKRYSSLDDDLELFKQAIITDGPDRLTGVVRLPNLEKKGVLLPVYKARKFRCKSLNRGCMGGIRVIYSYSKTNGIVILTEIYFKGNQENHNEQRIIDNFKGLNEEDVKKKFKSKIEDLQIGFS